jgi:hypothetical protein
VDGVRIDYQSPSRSSLEEVLDHPSMNEGLIADWRIDWYETAGYAETRLM